MVSPEDSESVLKDLEKDIHNINSLSNIIRSIRCQVDLSKILNCQAYDASVSHIPSPCSFFEFMMTFSKLILYVDIIFSL